MVLQKPPQDPNQTKRQATERGNQSCLDRGPITTLEAVARAFLLEVTSAALRAQQPVAPIGTRQVAMLGVNNAARFSAIAVVE
jgi:hypothetical protein